MRRIVFMSLIALLCAAPAAAQMSMKQRLKKAGRQYNSQEYERVIRILAPLTQSPIATISDKVAAFELLGLSYLILGDTARARTAFEDLLGLDAGHVLRDPSQSPKLRKFFESVKESFVPGYHARFAAKLEHAAPGGATAGRKVEFIASVVQGQTVVEQVLVRWRRAGLLTYRTRRMKRSGGQRRVSFLLPRDSSSYRVEYYIEARNEGGAPVARVGAPGRPLVLKVSGKAVKATRSIWRSWWLWTAVGVVVIGSVTAGIVAGSADSAPAGSLEPTIQLR